MRRSHLQIVPFASEKANPFRRLVNATYSRSNPDVVTLYARDDEGKLHTRQTKADHSCFVKIADLNDKSLRQLRESKYVEGVSKTGDHYRIRWRDPWSLAKVVRSDGWFGQRGIETWEADVDPVRRYLTDHNIEIGKPVRCYIDIETDSRKGIVEARNGRARILSWAIVDDDGKLVKSAVLDEDTDASERELVIKFWHWLQRFDQVCAWNGDWFDFPALIKRSQFLRIRVDASRFLLLDHMVAFERMNKSASKSGDEKQSMKLDSVAKSLGLSGKTEGVDGSKTWELWCADKNLLLEYNENDTLLEQQIEQKTKYLEQLYALCALTYTFPDSRGMKPTRQVEGFLMKLGSRQGMRFPNRAQIDEDEEHEKYDGAYRMEPECNGVEKDVHVCDFSGMYPNFIRSFNLSIETVRGRQPDLDSFRIPAGCAVVPITRVEVVQEPRGILPQALDECIALRAKFSEQKASFAPGTLEAEEAERNDAACKAFVNSFYGVMGNIYSRFHVLDVAESTTQAGVHFIKAVIQAAKDHGWRVLYGDTDSAFVSGCTNEEFAVFVKWCNDVLFPKLLVEHGAKRNFVKLAYEKKFSRLVMVTKSRYAGLFEHFKGKKAANDSEPEVKGLEYKRGDGPRLGRQMQKEVIDLVLRKGIEDPLAYEAIVERYKSHVLEGQLDLEDFVLAKRLDKLEYVKKPLHAEVAEVLKKRGEVFKQGDKIAFVVTDGSDKLVAIPFCDYDSTKPETFPDRFYLWENLVYPPTMRFLEKAFPKHNWLKYERVRPSFVRGVLPGQLGFGLGEAPVPPPRKKKAQ